jgi:hypothetical protein
MRFMVVVLLLVLAGVFAGLLGHWVLRPLGQAMKRLNAPTRFVISDFLWLLVLLQFSLGFTVSYFGDKPQVGERWAVIVLLAIANVLLWVGAISTLSRARVRNAARRAVFVLFLLPMVVALMIALMALVFSVPVLLDVARVHAATQTGLLLVIYSFFAFCIYVGLVLAILGVGWLLRLLTGWILIRSDDKPEPAEPEATNISQI